MYCRNCGKELDANSTFCSVCGTRTDNAPQATAQQPVINVINSTGDGYIRKNKWIAFFLCLFLGGIGAHRFYVGKIGTGIIWLLTVGLFGIGSLIDLIVILCGGFKDKAGQPLA